MHSTIISHSEAETIAIAQRVCKAAVAMLDAGQAVIIGLNGTLGMGKSVFARAFIRSFMGDDQLNVPSPTFTLVQYYERGDDMLYHYDLYRLEDAEEIYEIGWEESLSDGISLVEWPERLMGIKPPQILDIYFEPIHNQEDRKIIVPGSLLP